MYNQGFRKIYDCGSVVFTLGQTPQNDQVEYYETLNIVKMYEPKKRYGGLNRRLLMYELNGFDYSKRRNKAYCDRFYTRFVVKSVLEYNEKCRKDIIFCIKRKVDLVKTTK